MSIILTNHSGSLTYDYTSNFVPNVGDAIYFFYELKVVRRIWYKDFILLVCE